MLIDITLFLVVLAFGIFLLTLAGLLVFSEERGKNFLLGFATSAFTHYLEISLRIIVGAALVVWATKMLFSPVFLVFGWLLIGTSAVLAVIPWQWHKRFADLSVPPVLKYPKLLAIVAAAMGSFILFCLVNGPTV